MHKKKSPIILISTSDNANHVSILEPVICKLGSLQPLPYLTVKFSFLFSKLENLGIRALPLALIKTYFKNRRQFVVYRGVESNLWDILVGVAQGSILGSLFFPYLH